MWRLRSHFVLFATLTALVFVAGAALLEAQATDENVIQYRQTLMAGHGVSMGSIADMMKYKFGYGPQQVEIHARNLSEYAKLIPEVFENEITAGATDAKPEIWQNWDDFVAKAKALETAAGKLSASAGGGPSAIMPELKATGGACRNCHDNYRKPKEESYKNE